MAYIKQYEELIKEKTQNNLDLLFFLKIHTPPGATDADVAFVEEKWKHCALDLLVKKGIVQDRDGLTPEEVWQTAKNSFTQEKF